MVFGEYSCCRRAHGFRAGLPVTRARIEAAECRTHIADGVVDTVARIDHVSAECHGAGIMNHRIDIFGTLGVQRRTGRIGRVQTPDRNRTKGAAQPDVSVTEVGSRAGKCTGVRIDAGFQSEERFHAATKIFGALEAKAR